MDEAKNRNDDDAVLFEGIRGGVRVSVVTAALFALIAVVLFTVYFRTLTDEMKLPALVWFVIAMLVPGFATASHRLAMRCYRRCTASFGTAESS
ncbi:hypothetical protein [Rubripirellula tenax]|nr:hypothetical protein [Rubripirellula tenax]